MNLKDYIGKLVVVSHWRDFDLEDATRLGILERIDDEGYFYIEGVKRAYRHLRLVSDEVFDYDNPVTLPVALKD